jgi:HEAT repeat protein
MFYKKLNRKHSMGAKNKPVSIKGRLSMEALVRDLKDRSDYVRAKAAKALGKRGDSRAAEPLIKALKDQSELVRREAIEAFGRLEYYRVVEPLIEAIVHDESLYVRARAAEVLETLIGALEMVRQQCS